MAEEITPVEKIPETGEYLQRWERVLVTGASSGLGREFARQLASRTQELVIVARRQERLEDLAAELEAAHGHLRVHVYQADLTDRGHRLQLIEALTKRNLLPELLINNAGMGDYGDFISSEWEKIEAMMELNITALTHLTHALLPALIASGNGGIINISSLASIVPIPDFAVYAASKSYVTSFSESLRIELLEHQVPVLAVCPGPVHTEFGKTAIRTGGTNGFSGREQLYVESELVVWESLYALSQNRPRLYPGLLVAGLATAVSLLPFALVRLLLSSRPRRAK